MYGLLGQVSQFISPDPFYIYDRSSSTRGLDASTALEFVRALRIATDAMQLSTVVSIYQAGESLYKHFDKVCVIYEGRMAYFGPAHKARDYFIEMG
jgi:ATP-binding cassette subfamily G (WHITE) protein 2 (SNQ2)